MDEPLLSKNWLVKRIAAERLSIALRQYARGALLDIGCGDKPYAELTSGLVDSHVGIDHEETLHDASRIDMFGTAYEIPVADGSFETVLCTSVLEHLEEPSRALAEANRVLAAGGHAICTAPLFWHLHEEPRDFYRYTEYGLTYLFEANGFEVVELVPLSGFLVTFGQELVYYLWRFRKGGKINPLWWVVPLLGTLVQTICYALNNVDRSSSFTWMYLIIARKI